MKGLILFAAILLIFECFYLTSAYVGSMEVTPVDGKCVGPNGELFAPGESWLDNKNCESHSCEVSDGKFYEEFTGCAPIAMGKEDRERNCRFEAGTGPFPDCCPYHLVCNDF